MTLPTSGPISLTDIATEFGGSGDLILSDYYGVDLGVPTDLKNNFPYTPISLSDFYNTTGVGPTITNTYATTTVSTTNSFTFNSVPIGSGAGSIIVVTASINAIENSTISIGSITLAGNAMKLVTKNKGTAIYQISSPLASTSSVVVNISGGSATRCAINVYRIYGFSKKNPSSDKIYNISEQVSSLSLLGTPPVLYRNCVGVGVAYFPSSSTTFNKFSNKWLASQNVILSSTTRHLGHYISAENIYLPEKYILPDGTMSYSIAIWR